MIEGSTNSQRFSTRDRRSFVKVVKSPWQMTAKFSAIAEDTRSAGIAKFVAVLLPWLSDVVQSLQAFGDNVEETLQFCLVPDRAGFGSEHEH